MLRCHRGPLVAVPALVLVVGCQPSHQPPTSATPSAVDPVQPARAATVDVPVVPPPAATSSPTSQPATVLKSAPASIDLIVAGRKTSTTRKGVRAYPLGSAVVTDGRRRVAVEITRIDPKRFGDVTVADAASDGWASLGEYRAALLHSYPGLGDDDTVSVVHVRLANPR